MGVFFVLKKCGFFFLLFRVYVAKNTKQRTASKPKRLKYIKYEWYCCFAYFKVGQVLVPCSCVNGPTEEVGLLTNNPLILGSYIHKQM